MYKCSGVRDLDYATSVNNLAYCYARLENYKKACTLEEEALTVRREQIDDKSSQLYLNTLVNMGSYYMKTEQYSKAIDIYKEELNLKNMKYGPKSSSIISTLTNMAICCFHLGKSNEAESYCLESISIRKKWVLMELSITIL